MNKNVDNFEEEGIWFPSMWEAGRFVSGFSGSYCYVLHHKDVAFYVGHSENLTIDSNRMLSHLRFIISGRKPKRDYSHQLWLKLLATKHDCQVCILPGWDAWDEVELIMLLRDTVLNR